MQRACSRATGVTGWEHTLRRRRAGVAGRHSRTPFPPPVPLAAHPYLLLGWQKLAQAACKLEAQPVLQMDDVQQLVLGLQPRAGGLAWSLHCIASKRERLQGDWLHGLQAELRQELQRGAPAAGPGSCAAACTLPCQVQAPALVPPPAHPRCGSCGRRNPPAPPEAN